MNPWFLASLLACGPGPADPASVRSEALPAEARALWSVGDTAVLETSDGARFRIGERGLTEDPDAPDPFDPVGLDDLVPDSWPTEGQGFERAWLAGPTERYPHGALGDLVEARALRMDRGGGTLELALPEDAVFEDLQPRPVDLEGDGADEILVVRATLDGGASLVVAGVVAEALQVVAEGPEIGTPQRWMDPVGHRSLDLDGDGAIEVAVVVRPHLDGTLTLLRHEAGELVVLDEQPGYSNHEYGATDLRRSALVEDGLDGLPTLVVPDAAHQSVVLLTAGEGRLDRRSEVALDGRIATDFAVLPDGQVVFAIDGAELIRVRP